MPTFWPLLADNDCGFFTVIILRILWIPDRNNEATARLKVLCESSSSLSFNNYHRQSSLSTWNSWRIIRNPALAAWVVLMDFSVLRQVPLMIITFFFASHEIQKKSWWFQRHVLNFTWKTVCSNFLNWKPKRGYLFLNGHNDQTWPSRHIIGFSFFQNCTHFSICRNFKETYYCMQFSPLFVCLSAYLGYFLITSFVCKNCW